MEIRCFFLIFENTENTIKRGWFSPNGQVCSYSPCLYYFCAYIYIYRCWFLGKKVLNTGSRTIFIYLIIYNLTTTSLHGVSCPVAIIRRLITNNYWSLLIVWPHDDVFAHYLLNMERSHKRLSFSACQLWLREGCMLLVNWIQTNFRWTNIMFNWGEYRRWICLQRRCCLDSILRLLAIWTVLTEPTIQEQFHHFNISCRFSVGQ